MDYRTLRALYDRVVVLPRQEREAFLDAEGLDAAARAEILALLAEEDTPTECTDPIAHRIAREASRAVQSALPERVGPWRILDVLGEGGMGMVLLGERADGAFEMQVAIKVIAGMASNAMRERFRRERQVLAALDHPHIAGLIDGGTTEAGEPYLVMPYIEGDTLKGWLERTQPSLRTRLALFVKLCRAVHHAHQHLVVHRDLKPANVMVRADGSPVLLDFGIAKLLDDTSPEAAARTATRMMTPRYASPEQLLGLPVTTATDIYGLGLLLYELLAGNVPERGDAQRAASVELPPPSQQARDAEVDAIRTEAPRLRGDLDRIVRRAVRTDMSARYPSAQALAEDIEAYLDGRPVQAAGRHRMYLLRRFVKRHRVGVAVGGVALCALIAIAFSWKAERDRALVAEQVASREAAAATGVTDFLIDLFAELDPSEHPGRELSARELLDIGREQLQSTELARPELRARLQQALGWIYANAGETLPAIELLEASLAARESEGLTLAQVRTQGALARAYNTAQRHQESLELASAAVRGAEALQPPEPKQLAHALMIRGVAEYSLNRGADAESSFDRAQALFESVGAVVERASVLHNRAWMAEGRGDYPQALAWYDQALADKLAAHGPDHPKTLVTQHGRGKMLAALGRHAEAVALFRDLLERAERVHGPESQYVQNAHAELASASQDLGEFAIAQEHYEKALELAHALSGGAPSMSAAVGANNLGSLLEDRGNAAEAERRYRESLAMRRQVLPAGHPSIATPLHNLTRLLLAGGRAAEAVPLGEEAFALRSAHEDAWHPLRLRTGLLLAEARAAAGDVDGAHDTLEPLATLLRRHHPDQPAVNQQLQLALAAIAAAGGRADARAEALAAAVEAQAAGLDPNHPRSAALRLRLAEALLAAGKHDLAAAIVDQVAPILRKALVPEADALRRLAAIEASL